MLVDTNVLVDVHCEHVAEFKQFATSHVVLTMDVFTIVVGRAVHEHDTAWYGLSIVRDRSYVVVL